MEKNVLHPIYLFGGYLSTFSVNSIAKVLHYDLKVGSAYSTCALRTTPINTCEMGM